MSRKINKLKNFLFSRDFLLGFEIEFIYDSDKIEDYALEEKLRKIHPDIILDDDGSIDFDGYFNYEESAEIQTPPLPAPQAIAVLTKVFNLVNKYGYTNESCGFHVNISPKSNKLFYSIDPFKFTTQKLWTQIKKEFKRENNEYCCDVFKDNKIPSKLQIFKGILGNVSDGYESYNSDELSIWSGKDAAVNFENYFLPRSEESRVEIRAFGGPGYSRKLEKIKDYTNKILNSFVNCCSLKT